MSQKVHAKSPLLGKHSNNAEDEGVLTVHYSTAAGNYCSQRPNSTLLDGQSNMRASTSANEIPVEDDSWVGGRRPEKRRRDTIFGYILLIIALAMFTAQTEATNVLQTRSYRKPYFILWVVHSALSLILPVQLAFEYWTSSSLRRYVSRIQRAISNLHGVSPVCATVTRESTNNTDAIVNINDTTCDITTAPNTAISSSPVAPSSTGNSDTVPSMRHQLFSLGIRSLWLSILLAAGAYLWYVAAGMTSSATLTAIYNASCCFVYVFSVLFFGEAIRVIKVLAVLLSIGGVAYMSFADSHRPDDSTKLDVASITSHNDTFVGDLVALGSAIIVGLYQVMYRHYAVPRRHNSLHFVNTMVGLMGVFTLLVCWIPIPILHWAGWERFEWPDAGAWGWIAVIAISGILYNICYTFVIALISPLFASVGIMLTIPIVALTDWLLQGKPVTLAMALGSTGILLGFGLLISTSWKEEATYRAEPITKLSDDTEEEDDDDEGQEEKHIH